MYVRKYLWLCFCMSAVHLCHQCDNVFVCVRSVVLTIVMQTLCISVGRAGFIQICYEFKNIWKMELSARPRVVGVFCHELQEAWKLPKTALNSFNGSVLDNFYFFQEKVLGIIQDGWLVKHLLAEIRHETAFLPLWKIEAGEVGRAAQETDSFQCWPLLALLANISQWL